MTQDLRGYVGNMDDVYFILGLKYKIRYNDTHLAIGRKQFTIEEWSQFTDAEIFEFDGADGLEWWNEYHRMIFNYISDLEIYPD